MVLPEYLTYLISSRFQGQAVDRLTGVDEKQYKQLPVHLRQALVHGSDKEFWDTLTVIRTMERRDNRVYLGPGAYDLVLDMRDHSQGDSTSKVERFTSAHNT